jgi:hypothetical protein
MSDLESKFQLLQTENEELKKINNELEERLKKYTNNNGHKKYLNSHKEQQQEAKNKYLQKLKETNPDKIKEYNKKAYEKQKAKKALKEIGEAILETEK